MPVYQPQNVSRSDAAKALLDASGDHPALVRTTSYGGFDVPEDVWSRSGLVGAGTDAVTTATPPEPGAAGVEPNVAAWPDEFKEPALSMRGPINDEVLDVFDPVDELPGVFQTGDSTLVDDGPAAVSEPHTLDTVDGDNGGFDPAVHTVAEVRAYLATVDGTEQARVIDAERDGKNRASLVDA